MFCISTKCHEHPVVTPEGIAAVEAFVKGNRRVTVNEIAAHLDMSHGSAHHMVAVMGTLSVVQGFFTCTVDSQMKTLKVR